MASVRHVLMRGAIVTVVLGGALWLYLVFAASTPPSHLLVTFFAVPAVLGLIAYVAIVGSRGWVLWLVWLPFLISAVPLFAMPGDPAKPGLQWVLYGPLLASVYVGEFIAWAFSRLFRGKAPDRGSHA